MFLTNKNSFSANATGLSIESSPVTYWVETVTGKTNNHFLHEHALTTSIRTPSENLAPRLSLLYLLKQRTRLGDMMKYSFKARAREWTCLSQGSQVPAQPHCQCLCRGSGAENPKHRGVAKEHTISDGRMKTMKASTVAGPALPPTCSASPLPIPKTP